MAAKLTRLTHKTAIKLHPVAAFAVLATCGQSGNFWTHTRIFYAYLLTYEIHVKWVPCHHILVLRTDMVSKYAEKRPINVLNKLSRTADIG